MAGLPELLASALPSIAFPKRKVPIEGEDEGESVAFRLNTPALPPFSEDVGEVGDDLYWL